jgi:hypothetical protein
MSEDIPDQSDDLIEIKKWFPKSFLEKFLESDIILYELSGYTDNSFDGTHLY